MVFVVLALVIVLALANLAGSLGQSLFKFLSLVFGVMIYLVPLILLSVAVSLYNQDLKDSGKSSSLLAHLFGRGTADRRLRRTHPHFYLSNELSGFALPRKAAAADILGRYLPSRALLFRFFGPAVWCCLVL